MLVADESPKSLLRTNMFSRLLKGNANVLPLPQERSKARLRLAKPRARIRDGPITNQMVLLEFLIELFKRHGVLALAQGDR
jgi:hypothetical protein